MRQAARDGSDPETEKFDAEGHWPLPDGWVWTRVGRAAEVNPKTTLDTIEPDEEIPFVPMAAVSEEAGAIDISHTRCARDVTNGYVRFRQGDVIFAKIPPAWRTERSRPFRRCLMVLQRDPPSSTSFGRSPPSKNTFGIGLLTVRSEVVQNEE